MKKNIWITHPGNNNKQEETTMRTRVSVLTVVVTVLAALALLVPGAALAVGTLAGTTVSNDATVDYKVSGVDQTTITSSAISFTVDAKVDFAIIDSGGVGNTVTPAGATDTYYLTFTLTNNGNVGLDLDLDAYQASGDDFDQTLHANTFYVDANNDAIYDGGDTLVTYVDELEVGLSNTIFVVAAVINSPQPDGDIANIILNATAFYNSAGTTGSLGGGNGVIVADTGGDDNSGPLIGGINLDWILADDVTSGDGIEGVPAAFVVSTASLTITKTSTLLSDPINGTTNPVAIPGARISFTLQIDNGAGGAIATAITISDTMPANLTYTSAGITVINSLGAAGGTFGLTNASDGTEYGNAAGELSGSTVTVSGITLDAGERTQMMFNATID